MLRSKEKEKWIEAERKELDQIASKDTWRKVKRPIKEKAYLLSMGVQAETSHNSQS